MKHMRITKNDTISWKTIGAPGIRIVLTSILFLCLILIQPIIGNGADDSDSNEKMLAQYIQSKGKDIIIFEASNIKQFWVDPSVMSYNDSIEISLNEGRYESIPHKIQLANVNETQDCRIDVFTNTKDLSFSVLDNTLKEVSSSQKEENFINYYVFSSCFHLESITNSTFFLKFSSPSSYSLSIKKIVLSFSKNTNSSFLVSPGKIYISYNDIQPVNATGKQECSDNAASKSFSLTGKHIIAFCKNKIFASDTPVSSSFIVKNIGDSATTVSLGFGCYSKNKEWINHKNYPYNNINNILTVVSAAKGDTSIIVDSYSEWRKGCFLALNAMQDMSDVPTSSFLEGTIVDVKKLDDGQAVITMSNPLRTKINEGTKVRIHGLHGVYLYPMTKRLAPGEEMSFSASIKKDDTVLQYSPNAFSRGVYYVVPMILSYSVDPNKDNSILVEDYSVSY